MGWDACVVLCCVVLERRVSRSVSEQNFFFPPHMQRDPLNLIFRLIRLQMGRMTHDTHAPGRSTTPWDCCRLGTIPTDGRSQKLAAGRHKVGATGFYVRYCRDGPAIRWILYSRKFPAPPTTSNDVRVALFHPGASLFLQLANQNHILIPQYHSHHSPVPILIDPQKIHNPANYLS